MIIAILLQGLLLFAILSVITGEYLGSDLWTIFKAGLLALATHLVAFMCAVPFAFVLPGPLAMIFGFAIASVGLGYLISIQYGTKLKPTVIGMGVYFAVQVVLSFLMGA